MHKILISITTAVFAVSTFFAASSAQAGMKGKLAIGIAIGAMGAMAMHNHREHRHWKKKKAYAKAKSQPKVYASKKKSSATKVAKVDKTDKVEETTQVAAIDPVDEATINENSSITTAAINTPAAAAVEQVANNPADIPASELKTPAAFNKGETAAVDPATVGSPTETGTLPSATTTAGTATTVPAVTPAPVPAPVPAPQKTAKSVDCKKFFPSVGLTLSVPCE